MMEKIRNLQKIVTSFDIFVKEKLSPNDFKNLPLTRSVINLGYLVFSNLSLLISCPFLFPYYHARLCILM